MITLLDKTKSGSNTQQKWILTNCKDDAKYIKLM